MLAQRYHPDNKDTGDERRFREIQEAYSVLTDPEKRARLTSATSSGGTTGGGWSRPARTRKATSRSSRWCG